MMFINRVFILIQFFSIIQSTIDMKFDDWRYIANHLTNQECRQLVVSLYFITYELPDNMKFIVNKMPRNTTCLRMLVNWNRGTQRWEGKHRSHVDVEHRLRQLGKHELADWLGNTVFHRLAKAVNDSLLSNQYNMITITPVTYKPFSEYERKEDNNWACVNIIIFVVVGLLFSTSVYACIRVCLLRREAVKDIETKNLINDDDLYDESDDETLVSFFIRTKAGD